MLGAHSFTDKGYQTSATHRSIAQAGISMPIKVWKLEVDIALPENAEIDALKQGPSAHSVVWHRGAKEWKVQGVLPSAAWNTGSPMPKLH